MKKQLFWIVFVGALCIGILSILYYLKVNNLKLEFDNAKNQEKTTGDKLSKKEDSIVHTLTYAKSPADNPLKGFVGYQGTGSYSDFPISLEYIVMPISEIVIGKDEYDWSLLEKYLNEVASYGRQSILAFYLDTPGSELGIQAIPQYLLNEGLKVKEYTMGSGTSDEIETGFSPDYSNKDLWEMVYAFVEKLGKRYDGDVRIAQIEASIVGIWGEWHTSPYDFGLEDSQLSQLAKIYDQAFDKTQISCRYPKSGMENLSVGYSDYSFCYETIVDAWSQLAQLKKFNLKNYWKKNMGGGELMPRFVQTIFETEGWSLKEGESYEECVQALHPSWLLVGSLTEFDPVERENAINAASRLGYDFTVTQAYYSENIQKGTAQMGVGILIKNIGVAPFYYKWNSEIILVDQKGNEIYCEETDWDLTQIQPNGKEYGFVHNISLPDLEEGTYTILYQVINPLEGGYSLRFANETQLDSGKLILGSFSIGNTKPVVSKEALGIEETCEEIFDKYKMQITSKYLNDQTAINDNYILGVRIRNFGEEYVEDIDKVIINIYYKNKLIDSILTDWILKRIEPNESGYFAWQLKFEEKGEYELRIRFSPELEDIIIGSIQVN